MLICSGFFKGLGFGTASFDSACTLAFQFDRSNVFYSSVKMVSIHRTQKDGGCTFYQNTLRTKHSQQAQGKPFFFFFFLRNSSLY